jgi:putative transposase
MYWHRTGHDRQPAPRRPGHDYSEPGFYFITTVTRGRAPLLAVVRGRTLVLTPEGRIVARAISDVVGIAPGVTIDASVVMPDHVHVIFRLEFAGMVSVRQLVGRFKGRSANDVNVY